MNDPAINLTKLSGRTGYSYSSIRAMKLPLIKGKIRESDFWRILKRRQDAMEDAKQAPASAVIIEQMPQDEGTLDELRAMCGLPAASQRPAESRPHTKALSS